MKRISLVLAPLLLSAALVSPATAAPPSRTGSAADTSLVDRQFVEQAKVWTRTDRTFGYVRFRTGGSMVLNVWDLH